MKFRYWYGSLQIVVLSLLAGAVYGSEDNADRHHVERCRSAISGYGQPTASASDALDMGFCFGLMDGLRGANVFLERADPSSAFCAPTTFSNLDLAKAFVAAVEANPKIKKLQRSLAAQIALRTAFPCKKGK